MVNPVVIVGGAAIALWLLLRGKKEEPAPEPVPQPPVKTTVTPPKVDEGGMVVSPANAAQKWQDLGYSVGYAHGSTGQIYNQVSADAPNEYQAYYSEGYRQGYNQGVADLTSGAATSTKPTSSWGTPQGSKSGSNNGPIIDYSTGRVTGINDTRIARPRRW